VLDDAAIRTALVGDLRTRLDQGGTTRLLSEVGLWGNTVRVDLALLGRAFEGFEIKGETDTLSRLPRQAEIYGLVFDSVTLVCAARHAAKAADKIPGWWGVTVASFDAGAVSLVETRPALPNPSPSAERIAGLLWKDEAVASIAATTSERGLSRLRLAELHAKLAATLPLCELRRSVFETLLARREWLDAHDPVLIGPRRKPAAFVIS
jgi:hypothetical protein